MYKRKTKLSPIHISLIALAILVVIAGNFIFHLSDNQDTDEKEVNQKSHLNLTALEVNA